MSNENKSAQAAPRATNSATITFGLLSLPVKVYTATSEENVSFNQLGPKSKAKLKQKLWDPVEDCEVLRADILRGYEHVKDQYVIFTNEEVKSLEEAKSKVVEIIEFVPADQVDSLYVEDSKYLGPDKGGDKVFALLAQVMEARGVAALGKWAPRGKEQLIMITAANGKMMMQQLYYANEIRSNENIGGAKFSFSKTEVDLASKLIDQLTVDEFAPGRFSDGYVERVKAAVETKLAGGTIEVVAASPKTNILDLEQMLKQSLGALPEKKASKKAEASKPAKKIKKAS